MKIGDNAKAFEYLGNSLTYDPKNARTILAAGSLIQDKQDMDVALVKYRVAATQTPKSAQLWNNIGLYYYNVLQYIILHHITSHYIILHHITSYYIILHHIILYYIILHHIISYYIILLANEYQI